MTASSFTADALVASLALSPAFEASVIPRDLLTMKPIESAWSEGIDFDFFCFVLALPHVPGFSHLIPLVLGVLFILCRFLYMHCLCPAVVCYDDMLFLFLSLAGNKGWWESNADLPLFLPSPDFSRPLSCVHLQKRVMLNIGNLKPGYILQHGSYNAGS